MTTHYGEQLPDLAATGMERVSDAAKAPTIPGAVLRIPVSVQVVIGSARLALSELARLAPGTTLTLQEKIGEPARILVNGREVACGTLFVLDETDGRLGITITEVSGSAEEP